jgi:Autotransporter beta-domain
MKIRTTSALGAFAVILLGAVSAEAQQAPSVTENTRARGPAEVFGGAGQIAISSDAALTIQRRTISDVEGGTTSIQLAPAADYFVINNLSVGGFVGFDYVTSGDNDSSRFSLGPRVGYNLPFSDLISIWPKAGFSYAHTSATTSTTTGGTTTSTTNSADAFALNLFVPVMFHPVQHFFAGFGPFLDADLSGDQRATVFGGKLSIGGWM